MDSAHLARILDYFDTHNTWDEAPHMALIEKNLRYHGTVSGLHAVGRASYLGIWRSVHRNLGLQAAIPKKVYGDWPEVAVLAELQFDPPFQGRSQVEAIWHLVYTPEGTIQEMSIMWSYTGPITL